MALRCVSESRRSSATNTPNTSARSTSWRATITSVRVKVVTGKIKATNGTRASDLSRDLQLTRIRFVKSHPSWSLLEYLLGEFRCRPADIDDFVFKVIS